MYSRAQLIRKYFNYWRKASNGKGHGVHSPFVFDFIIRVLNDTTVYADYEPVEQLRRQLINDRRSVEINDLGAGSGVSKEKRRSISSIAKNAAKPRKYGQLLYRIVKRSRPSTILELGTSLGITSSYLALANPAARVITIEGDELIHEIAKENFKKMGLLNIQPVPGNFDQVLKDILGQLPSVDFAFIDGNHRYLPTIQYFDAILQKVNTFSIVVMDDIHWSWEMEEAWDHCRQHPSVTLSIDLFFIGILFFKQSIKEKQHFAIRF
ncbi:MAG TPA: class I SAM-dependent methyltransferase [Chitinophagaceae bacterium]|nr:class I SAM-dependent methyltransferase [Chitinophagaceae bacterium]